MLSSRSLLISESPLELEIQSLRSQLQDQIEQNKFLKEEISQLQDLLLEFKRHRFGKKSERWTSEEQLVFNEVEVESKKPEPDQAESEISVKAHTKKRGKRKPLPDHLPREIEKIELPLDERFSEEGLPLKVIGWEISEKLDYEPAKTKVIQYHRAKYGIDSGDYIKTAPHIPSIIPKGIVTPGLLSGIVVSKYSDGLPLYRIEEIFLRMGIDIRRTSMARWVIKGAESLRPVINILSDRVLQNFYISMDETRIQVLKEKGRTAESQSWMWVRATPYGENKIVLFEYSRSRASDVAMEILEGYKGRLQVDGYAGYNKISEQEGVIRLGCNMHGRRYFEKAAKVGAKAGKTLGAQGLKYYKVLYDIEEEIRELPPDERFRLRQKKSVPIWDKFKAWVDDNRKKVPESSKIGRAFSYFKSEYEYLIGYLEDGRFEMDTGFVERCIRKFAIGRNNWLFSDSVAGAEASSLLYSLTVTAKVNNVNPYTALKYIFEEIPKAKCLEDYERLADIIVGKLPLP